MSFQSPQKKRREEREFSMSLEEANDRFYDLFRNHGFAEYPHSNRKMLVRFWRLLIDDQKRHNSTRLHTINEVGLKHFIDCLMVPRLVKLQFPLLDVGSGAGFPGIPLKIEFPDEQILLGEGVQKRVDFLEKVRADLGLKKLDIVGRKITPDFAFPVRGVITRAFAHIPETLRAVENCLDIGGRVFFMKGPAVDPEIPKAQEELKGVYRFIQDIPYEIPNSPHQRRLVVFEKLIPPRLDEDFE